MRWLLTAGLLIGGLFAMKKFNEIDIIARTIWGEARGEGQEGMHSVANVIYNRARSDTSWWGVSPVDVALKDGQFSAWNADDPNRALMLAVTRADPAFDLAWGIAQRAALGTLPDITGGATHYHAYQVTPYWAASLEKLGTVGNHIFYREA